MRLLCLDTSTAATSVALVEGTSVAGAEVLAARTELAAHRHGELLSPLVRQLLDEAGSGFDAVAVGVGPGPFTGLRAGIATAAAMAHAGGVPAYPACSLDLLAAPDTLVVQDARRREVYWAAYDSSARRVRGPEVAAPTEVPLNGTRLVGAGLLGWPEVFGEPAPGTPTLPVAEELWRLVAEQALAGAEPDPLTPLYLRRPDAKTLAERGLA